MANKKGVGGEKGGQKTLKKYGTSHFVDAANARWSKKKHNTKKKKRKVASKKRR